MLPSSYTKMPVRLTVIKRDTPNLNRNTASVELLLFDNIRLIQIIFSIFFIVLISILLFLSEAICIKKIIYLMQ